MLDQIKGIKIKGANFVSQTELNIFKREDDKIAKIALVYGKNGTGKSTTSNAFKKVKGENVLNIETASLYNNDSCEISISESDRNMIFVYNEDFVNDKVKIQKDGLGSIVILGERADLTLKIDQAEKERLDVIKTQDKIKEELKNYTDEKNIISPDYYLEKMTATLKENDGWAGRDRQIKNSYQNSRVKKDKYLDFIDINVSKSKSDLIVDFEEQIQELEKARQGTGKIEEIIKIPDAYIKFNYSAVRKLLQENIERPILSKRDEYLIKLIETGKNEFLQNQLDFFSKNEADYCPFCLQDISNNYKTDLLTKIRSVLSDNVKEHRKKLSEFMLDELQLDLTPFSKLKSYTKCCELLNEINIVIQKNNRIIQGKINSPYICINDDVIDNTSLIVELEKSLIILDEEREEYNKNIVNTAPIIEKLNSINSEIAYHDIIEDYNRYCKQNIEYQKLVCGKKTVDKLVADKTLLCKQLKAERERIQIAVDLINNGLEYIFFSKRRLEIIVDENKYKLLSNGKPVLPSNISVGERNIIALCYFFASMLQGKDDKIGYQEECLIIIDDPVSSYDFENKIGILSFLKLKLSQFLNGNLNSKAIILTHDLLTFFDIKKIADELQKEFNDSFGENKTAFNLYELKNCSLMKFQNKKRHEYTEMMKMIYEYSKGQCSDNSIFIGNIMRQVLEAFSTFEYKKGISEVSTNKSIINKLDYEYQSYFSNLMYRLVLHGGSHREEQIQICQLDFFSLISEEEKVRTAKDILCFIYLLNNSHLIAHLGDVSEDLNEWCSEIKNR